MLAAAITGGGFEVREMKIPKIAGFARFAAGLIGSLSLLLCVGLTQPSQLNSASVDGQSAAPSSVSFTVSDKLGQGQISEQVTLVVNGKSVGNLTVNEQYPESIITVRVPRPGSYSYALQADAYFTDGNGSTCRVNGVGQGLIDVDNNKRFFLNSSLSGNVCDGVLWSAHIEELQ